MLGSVDIEVASGLCLFGSKGCWKSLDSVGELSSKEKVDLPCMSSLDGNEANGKLLLRSLTTRLGPRSSHCADCCSVHGSTINVASFPDRGISSLLD